MSTSEIAKLESRWRDNPQGLTFAPLAEAYRKQKDARRALEILVPGLERHPDYIPANIVLGRCHWDLNDLEAAETAFARVLTLDGENVIALKALADIAERLSRPQEAERWLETLLAIDRSNDEARDQLVRIRTVQSLSPHIDTPAALAGEEVEPATGGRAGPLDGVAGVVPSDELSVEREPEMPPPPTILAPDPQTFSPPLSSDPFPSIADHIAGSDYSEPSEAGRTGWGSSGDSEFAREPAPVADSGEGSDSFEPFPADADDGDRAAPPSPRVGFTQDDPPFTPPSTGTEADGFRFERAEEIVLNPSGGTEFQTPDAAHDLRSADAESSGVTEDGAGELEPQLPLEPTCGDNGEPASDSGDEPEPAPPSAPPLGYQAYEVPAADLLPAGEPAAAQSVEPDTAEPDLVVTETMAQVFLRQGHVVEALAVYRELSSRDPGSERLRERVAELEARRAALAAPPPRPSFLARDTGGQSLGSFFSALLAARPASGPAGSGDGFGGVELSPETAPATRPAEEPLSLGSVFGEDPPAMAPAVPPVGAEAPPGATGGAAVSFDDFFAGAQVPAPAPTAPTRAPRRVKHDDDLDQFHTWLQGLKR
ncbi:MAG TPA: tetratricopeptide repeat protein [Gemmatimonadales bacterium]|nr:tetratricopeptide repeat protein [Gemmatimonadales bacterium]